MGVDFLRDEIGFVTTDRRRGKLPKLPASFDHYTTRFLISKKWHREALAALFSPSDIDCTCRNRIFNFISPYASSSSLSNNIKPPLPGIEHLVAIRVQMSEILSAGVELLSKTCPQLSRIELHAEARDLEGAFFEAVLPVIEARGSGYNTRQAIRDNDSQIDSNMARHFFIDMDDASSTMASRHGARIWRECLTKEALEATRWYAEIQHLSGLREATLMLTQREWFWVGRTAAEESNFSWNLWKIRWLLLESATRPKCDKIELPVSLVGRVDGLVLDPQLQGGGDIDERVTEEMNEVNAQL